jgi:hypothetical protein
VAVGVDALKPGDDDDLAGGQVGAHAAVVDASMRALV